MSSSRNWVDGEAGNQHAISLQERTGPNFSDTAQLSPYIPGPQFFRHMNYFEPGAGQSDFSLKAQRGYSVGSGSSEQDSAFTDAEKRFVLAEMIKVSHIDISTLVNFEKDHKIAFEPASPGWLEIQLPSGRNIRQCYRAAGEMFNMHLYQPRNQITVATDGEPRDELNTLTTSTLQEVMPRAASWAHIKRSDLPLDLKLGSEDHSALSDDAMSESHSPWTSDCSEDPPELDQMHPLRLVKPDLLRQVLLAFQTWRHHQNEGTGASKSADPSTVGTGNATDRPGGAPNEGGPGKRKETGDHDEEDERGLVTRPNKKRRCISQGLSFACPFAKKDPLKHKKCYTKTITRIQDVKLHLSREHQIPIHCPRCKASFKTQGLLYHHAEGSLCQPRHEPVYEGVNADQKALLKQRVSAKLSLEDQWFSVFDILFPGHQPRPLSPYVDSRLHIEIRAFYDMMLAEGPRLFNEAVESHGYSMTAANMEGDLTMLRELVVADALQAITNTWLAGICPEPFPSQEGQGGVQDLSSVGPASASSSTLYLTGPSSGTQDPASVDDRPIDVVSSPARSSEQSGPNLNQAAGVLTEPGMEQLPGQSHPSSANYHQDLLSDIADAMWPDISTSLVEQPLVMNDITANVDPDDITMSKDLLDYFLNFNDNGKLGFGGDLSIERHEVDPNP